MDTLSSFYNYHKSIFDIWAVKEAHVPLPDFVLYLASGTDKQREFFATQQEFNGLKKRFKAIETCIANDPTNTVYLEERRQTLAQLASLDSKLKTLLEQVEAEFEAKTAIDEKTRADEYEKNRVNHEQLVEKHRQEQEFDDRLKQEIARYQQN
jgi:hypothetical protein